MSYRLGENLVWQFHRPWALWGALTLAVVLWLLLQRRRWLPVTVPSHLLWAFALARQRDLGAAQQRWRFLPLLVWAAIVLLLVGAAMAPQLAETYVPPCGVIVLDNSLSMSSVDAGGHTRLARAKAEILAYVEASHRQSRFMLITTAPTPLVLVDWTSDRKLFQAALDPVDTAYAGCDLGEAMQIAVSYVKNMTRAAAYATSPAPVLLYTDGSQGCPKAEGVTSRCRVFNDNLGNVGLENFHVERDPYYLTYSARLSARNYGNPEQALTLTVQSKAGEVYREDFILAANAVKDWLLPVTEAHRGVLTATLQDRNGNPPDRFAPDNTAWAYLAGQVQPRVILVEKEPGASLFRPVLLALERLLDAKRTLITTLPDFVAGKAAAGKDDILIFDSCLPDAPLAPGHYVMFNARGKSLPFSVGDTFTPTTIQAPASRHELARFLRFDDLLVNTARRVEVAKDADIFASADGSPLLFYYRRDGVDILYGAFELGAANLSLLDTFPMLMANLFRQAATPYATIFNDSYAMGDTLAPAAAFHTDVEIARYEGALEAQTWRLQPDAAGRVSLANVIRPGLYFFKVGGEVLPPALVNFNLPAEARLDAASPGDTIALPALPAVSRWVGQPVGAWMLAAALLLLLGEWLWFVSRPPDA